MGNRYKTGSVSRLKAKIALLGPKEHPSFWSFHWLVLLCLAQFILSSPQAELLRKTLLINKTGSLETTHWYQGLQTVRNTLL